MKQVKSFPKDDLKMFPYSGERWLLCMLLKNGTFLQQSSTVPELGCPLSSSLPVHDDVLLLVAHLHPVRDELELLEE